jgi:hypothetical protein
MIHTMRTAMFKNLSIIIWSFVLLVLIAFSGCRKANHSPAGIKQASYISYNPDVKPFRVLVIIGDQWKDPLSYHIDSRRVVGEDFIDVVTMLKIWGVPFDILRLDEQRLQINRFLDGEAKPNYGCIIWMANPDILKGYSANYPVLKQAVEQYGTSMIILFDYIKAEPLTDIVGVDYQGITDVQSDSALNKFVLLGSHFITPEELGDSLTAEKSSFHSDPSGDDDITDIQTNINKDQATISLIRCAVKGSADVLATIGKDPQLVTRNINDETKVVWIGGGKNWFRKYSFMRTIFRKSLVYATGYGIFNDNFNKGFIFIMDDVGCSEHAWSLRWHYPTPSKEILEKHLIEPLEKHGLIMVQNITPGFANPKTHIIESPWTVKPFKDVFGNWQDYGSTKEGLDEGLRRGVFEIQAHRAWSHMNWDLDSPPGPWWGSAIDGEMDVTDWYNEVVDVRRDAAPVPSNDLLFIYRTGIDAIKKAFGVVPLAAEVRPVAELREGTHGGDDNGRIAAIAGLGVSRECYVGIDHTIKFSMMMPEQFTCHDLDLTEQTDSPADQTEAGWDKLSEMTTDQLVSSKIAGGRRINLRDNLDWISAHKNQHWMGFNECCAYLHTVIKNMDGVSSGIEFNYDSHYCKYFEKKPSYWTLELSDWYGERLGAKTKVRIDGKRVKIILIPEQVLEIPPGLGIHTLEIEKME